MSKVGRYNDPEAFSNAESYPNLRYIELDTNKFSKAELSADGKLTLAFPAIDRPMFDPQFIEALVKAIGQRNTDNTLDDAAAQVTKAQVVHLLTDSI